MFHYLTATLCSSTVTPSHWHGSGVYCGYVIGVHFRRRRFWR